MPNSETGGDVVEPTHSLSITNALCICLHYSKRGTADVYRVIFILFHEDCMDRPISISPFIKRLINVCFLYKLECYLIEKT